MGAAAGGLPTSIQRRNLSSHEKHLGADILLPHSPNSPKILRAIQHAQWIEIFQMDIVRDKEQLHRQLQEALEVRNTSVGLSLLFIVSIGLMVQLLGSGVS